MPIVQFTPAFIASGLVCPAGMKRIEYSIAGGPGGLFVECRSTPGAIPTWYLRLKKSTGTNEYRRLGTIKELTLSAAKKTALAVKAEHALALQQAKQQMAVDAVPAEMTLDTFWNDQYFPHAKVHKRSWLRDEQLYRIRIQPKFGHLALSTINRRDVQAFQNEIIKEGLSPASADHHVKLMRRILNLAVSWEYLDRNCLKGIPLLLVDNQIENYLDEEQLQRLLTVLHSDPNRRVCQLLMFLLSTGARSNEARQATWDQIDLANGVWRIPATNSKSKKVRSVPLNESACWVLEQVGTKDAGGVVFANPETGKAFTPVTHLWYRLRRKAKIPNVRVHDLRHSFASFLVSGGRSLYEVQSILGHSDPKVTMRYAHLSAKTLMAAANTASVIVPKPAVQAAPEVKLEEVPPAAPATAEILPFPRAA